ncbi:MAG TPA: acylphosphatase [Smithellaceae bacterium]|nr:acylphosphatase [Smithellaceae bacterium]HQM44330.1 acylphosphatase [Smithellaceae bacterium]
MKRMHVYVSGTVQGVFFRAETHRAAVNLRLTGWVRNRSDGRVEAVFEGEEGNIDQMMAWCRTGPSLARVEHVIWEEEPYTGSFSTFSISY